ncbi:hypothetical protein HPB49_019442 [Dermacentor silvarum]|uniref:Uncharacterized protein n=1 Tax=Dermacentor silvarum TaxID=543639 RepID=A0ACB8D7Q3_DERSI|nr:hypothetical protein HPB49_019442 [Dermacentor silvarum]
MLSQKETGRRQPAQARFNDKHFRRPVTMLFWPRVGVLLRSALSVYLFRLSLQRCLPEYRKIEGHTACLPRNYECDIVSSGLTPAEQKSFVDAHNKSTVKFPRSGQNLAAFWKSDGATNGSSSWVGNDIERAVKTWFEENHRYPPSGLSHFSENAVGPVGHFTQVIWASTQFMGCGAVRFRKKDGRGGATNFYVCNYAGRRQPRGQARVPAWSSVQPLPAGSVVRVV